MPEGMWIGAPSLARLDSTNNRILRPPAGKHAARRTRADDHIIDVAGALHAPTARWQSLWK
jgi:hypothetical protein